MKKIIMATTIGLIACVYAQNMGKKPDEGYRIEVVIDTIQKTSYVETQAREIRIVSPGQRIIKSIPFDKAILSEDKKYLLCRLDHKIKENYDEIERALFNARGEQKWKKKWKTYPGGRRDPELLCPYWDEGISHDGSAFYVMYIDSFDTIHLAVFDTTGREVVNVICPSELRDIEISNGGKIIAAMTGRNFEERKGYAGPYFFFLDVESGKTKIVKAEGITHNTKWKCRFIISSGTPPPSVGKIRIDYILLGEEYDKIPGGRVKSKEVAFDEIPDDLSTLFLNGGEK